MRLKIVFFFWAGLFLISVPLQAQFRYGIKAGMNLSTLHFNQDLVSPDVLPGYSLGLTSEWMSRRKHIGVELSTLYSLKGISYHSKKYTTNYIDIPLSFKWRYPFLFGDLFLKAGPYVSFSVGEKQWDKISTTGSPRATAKDKDFGLQAGVGILLLNHFQFGVGYDYGLIDSYEVKRSSGRKSYAQTRNWNLSVAYLF